MTIKSYGPEWLVIREAMVESTVMSLHPGTVPFESPETKTRVERKIPKTDRLTDYSVRYFVGYPRIKTTVRQVAMITT